MSAPAHRARSWLFVPGDRPDRFAKAARAGADATILDLEDAVSDAAKTRARTAVAAWLSPEHPAYVRINPPGTDAHDEDLAAVLRPGLAGLMVPKAEDPEGTRALALRLPPGVTLVPLVETALGVWNARRLAATPTVERLAFGSVDLQLDAGVDGDDDALLYARSRLVLASRVARVSAPVDGVTTTIADPARLVADVDRARRLGFAGKLCIHPDQVPAVNDGFAPTPRELTWARRVVSAAAATAHGALRIDGEMVDRPVLARAASILARATCQPKPS
jgi:citrate lyase subunit beta/citryl-CoA lyase